MKRIVMIGDDELKTIDCSSSTYFQNNCWFNDEDDDLIAFEDANGQAWMIVND